MPRDRAGINRLDRINGDERGGVGTWFDTSGNSAASRLRDEDPKKWTQARIAKEFGVSRQAVQAWFSMPNAKSGNTHKPREDARVKVDPTSKPVIAERVASGETQEQVAADYGLTGFRQLMVRVPMVVPHSQMHERRTANSCQRPAAGAIRNRRQLTAATSCVSAESVGY